MLGKTKVDSQTAWKENNHDYFFGILVRFETRSDI